MYLLFVLVYDNTARVSILQLSKHASSALLNDQLVVVRPHRSTSYMRPIATDGEAWSVGLSVTILSPAKTAGPIEMSFGMWTCVGQGTIY